MDFKKKWQHFWTLNRHHDGGFTLVELIIVIAIMAILAGAAVPAYQGYIGKAKTAGDQQLLDAVNKAFASACMEAKVDAENVTEAAISMVDQKVYGLSKVASTVTATSGDANANFSKISAAFAKYYIEANPDAVFKTPGVNSLQWENGGFVMKMDYVDTFFVLSDGTVLDVPKEALAAIKGSAFDEMGSEKVLEMLGKNIESAKAIFALSTGGLGNIAGIIGGIIGNDSIDIKQKVKDSLKEGGSFYDLIPAEQRDEILAQFNTSAPSKWDAQYWGNSDKYEEDKAAYDAAQEKANSQLANAAALYVGSYFSEKNITGSTYASQLLTSDDPVSKVGDLAGSTGGMGSMLLNAAISGAAKEAFINSAGSEGYQNYITANPGKSADDYLKTDAGKADYATYLKSPACEKDLDAFVHAMTTVNDNVDTMGRADYIENGINDENLNELIGSLIG